ncbi:MAG: hypothetical protein EBQ89_03440 [Alphaproteobacteria bacterium]|nr:hypothetical protein [Alphaproteobacteria bacterium]
MGNEIEQSTIEKPKNKMPIDPQILDTLLRTGVQATSTIAGQRAASGKSALRQERIASCGRKPLFGRKKKEEYRKCVEEAGIGMTKSTPSDLMPPSLPEEEGSGNMKFVYIGLGILALGVISFIVYKKFGK